MRAVDGVDGYPLGRRPRSTTPATTSSPRSRSERLSTARAAVGTIGGFTPTGSVDFTFYANGTCTGAGSSAGTVALDGSGVAHPSQNRGPLAAGAYSFRAHYNGDANYLAGDSACEPLTVRPQRRPSRPRSTTPATTSSQRFRSGRPFTTGPRSADRRLHTNRQRRLHLLRERHLHGGGSSAGIVALDGSGVAHPSQSRGPLAAGSYSFRAHYNGDANYLAGDSACEPLSGDGRHADRHD